MGRAHRRVGLGSEYYAKTSYCPSLTAYFECYPITLLLSQGLAGVGNECSQLTLAAWEKRTIKGCIEQGGSHVSP